MSLDRPRWVRLAEAFAGRPHAAVGLRAEGLWVSGDLSGLARHSLAIVGSRAPSEGGRSRARELARALASEGITIVSGLALGIDAAAHQGALDAGGTTVGVLGGGHRAFFPPRNRVLAETILDRGGAVVSPYPPDHLVQPFQFLQRNAIVAALADAVIVVEAAARSGALNTAAWAGGRGLTVFALPGDVDRPKAAGCNALIRDGATLARDASDVLSDLGWAPPDEAQAIAAPGLFSPLETALLEALAGGPLDLEALLDRSGAPTGAVLAALVQLELRGAIERRDDSTYARTKRAA